MNQSKPFVDRQSPVPAYQQIASSLIDRITHEQWAIGERLPPEGALAEEYCVSRVTLRQALGLLESDGIIWKHQGKGAFVRENPNLFVQELNFPSVGNRGDALKESEIVSKRVEIHEVSTVARDVYAHLHVPQNTALIYLQRLFVKKRKTLGLNRVWFPAERVPELGKLGLVSNSISKTLSERYEYKIAEIENMIASVKLDAVTAQLLETNYDAAALKIDSVHMLEGGQPIEFSSTLWVGDCTRFHLQICK